VEAGVRELLRRPDTCPLHLAADQDTRPGSPVATSTQLPLAKLSELLTHDKPEPGLSGEFPSTGPTLYLTVWVKYPKMDGYALQREAYRK